jgi:imidazolonepropionase-like amidohydrolase
MKALTLNPAQIWGVDKDLGSLDVGKMANVVVANGDPLDVKTDVKHVFIGGEEIPLVNKQTELRDQYAK